MDQSTDTAAPPKKQGSRTWKFVGEILIPKSAEAGSNPPPSTPAALGEGRSQPPEILLRDCPAQENGIKRQRALDPVWRAAIEIGFIIFLFYSNLLMGEFERSNSTGGKSLVIALLDIFTPTNFGIAILSSLVGYLVFEYLRKKV
jgi:hypothetical protein